MKTLDRPFKVIAFDWDGTAVMSRAEDATEVRLRLERLLNLDARIVIITGTSFPNVDRQFSSAIYGPHKQNLYVCTNRGSEVYGFDAQSHATLVWRRFATASENGQLSATAERVRSWLEERTGLEIKVIYDRLNRRKIDLIPLPEWRDPPKSEIGSLLRAVEERLHQGGIEGGLREVIDFSRRVAVEEGLADPRITSDVKHVEIGLTDKGDSVEWMIQEMVAKGGLGPREVLIVGDEFGPIDGFPGSDFMMVRPVSKEATYVSVGKEPNGVPPEVIHVGGGPARFQELLDQQIALHERERPPVPPVEEVEDTWLLTEDGFNLAREHEFESIFSIGNGYLGTRGSLAEGTTISRPATFIAGVFDRRPGSGRVPELVKAPDWASLRIFVDGEELRLEKGHLLEHRRIIDLRRGMMLREWRHRDAVGRTTRLSYVRFASLVDRHVLAQSVTIIPENYGGALAVESALDGSHIDPDDLTYLQEEAPGRQPLLAMRVAATGVELAFAMATSLEPRRFGQPGPPNVRSGRSLVQRQEWLAEMGHEYRVEKMVTAYTSRDVADPAAAAVEHLARITAEGMLPVQEAHERAWVKRWEQADVAIEGRADDQRAARFAIYHLISAANPEDPYVSIGARGLTGEAYKGHVFWDTEIFMVPFFTYTDPETARSLLMYRYHTLPAARERAQGMGYRGALYAWESTDTGEDVTPSHVINPEGQIIRILCGEIEHHISADVAYAVWQYWQATGDERFLREAGAEIILETARFWASRAEAGAGGRYHIRRVIGPDEYHEAVDDNAYTNVMAQWNIEQALAMAAMLRRRWPDYWSALAKRLTLDWQDLDEWRNVAHGMYTGFDPKSGLFEQFQGFFDLEHINLADYQPRTAPIDVVLGRERTQASQAIKQADVVMLIYLLWDRFPPEVREKNFRYYEPRCDHGSSLSPAIHGLVAARLGDLALAERYYKQTKEIDLANKMGNAASGVHMAAQGGLWQALVFGFGGLGERADALSFDPRLPASWCSLHFPVQWRGRRLRLLSERARRVEVRVENGDPMAVALGDGQPVILEPGKPGLVRRWSELRRSREEVA